MDNHENHITAAEGAEHTHDHVHEFHHHHGPGEPEHTHTYHHSHEHEHGPDHEHEHPCELTQEDMAEILALMKYMANHNADHTRELSEVAVRLQQHGFSEAYDKAMKAVALFTEGTGLLNEALAAIEK